MAEIVGLEGMQEQDRLILHSAERIRLEFLCQNAYSEDAFSAPEQIMAMIDGDPGRPRTARTAPGRGRYT